MYWDGSYFPFYESDGAVAALFKDLDLFPAALHEFADALSQTDAMTEANAPQPFTRDIVSNYTGTHFLFDSDLVWRMQLMIIKG